MQQVWCSKNKIGMGTDGDGWDGYKFLGRRCWKDLGLMLLQSIENAGVVSLKMVAIIPRLSQEIG
jgi:hypothetical protein